MGVASALREDACQKPREACIQHLRAQGVHVRGADIAGMHQAGVAQDSEMMGHARFWPTAVQLAARGFARAGEAADDVHAYGVAQGVKHAFKAQVFSGRVWEGAHEGMITRLP
jgi:hypothetical protein